MYSSRKTQIMVDQNLVRCKRFVTGHVDVFRLLRLTLQLVYSGFWVCPREGLLKLSSKLVYFFWDFSKHFCKGSTKPIEKRAKSGF